MRKSLSLDEREDRSIIWLAFQFNIYEDNLIILLDLKIYVDH
jgi:hypothetical protein